LIKFVSEKRLMLIDTHTHLFLNNFDQDINEVIERAREKGVGMMLLPHIDSETSQRMLHLSFRYPGICLAMMGLHPGSVKENYLQELEWVESNLKNHKFVALGEIGMDLYWDKSYRKEQEIVFRKHLDWAGEYNLPLVIHSRNAVDELIAIISEFPSNTFKGVFHSLTGSLEQAQRIIELGFYIGIGGILTFKNSGLDRMVKGIGLENILVETDSPFLAPVPFRGKRNESSYLPYIIQKLAELYGLSFKDVADITTANAIKLFDLNAVR
jgi:TatD DNase family protein